MGSLDRIRALATYHDLLSAIPDKKTEREREKEKERKGKRKREGEYLGIRKTEEADIFQRTNPFFSQKLFFELM